jgi:hypothetical protein
MQDIPSLVYYHNFQDMFYSKPNIVTEDHDEIATVTIPEYQNAWCYCSDGRKYLVGKYDTGGNAGNWACIDGTAYAHEDNV